MHAQVPQVAQTIRPLSIVIRRLYERLERHTVSPQFCRLLNIEENMEFGIKMVRFSLIFNFVVTCCLSHPIEPNGTSMSALLTNMSQAIESIIEVSENFLDMVKRFETFEQSTQIDIDRLETITEAATIITQNIMVVSGYGQEGYINKTEIWSHPPKLQCPLQDFPLYLEGAVGFITAQDPVLCGGRGDLISNQCYVFNKGWMPWKNMTSVRAFASSIRISSHKTLIIGGFDENENALKTTELMSASGAEEANDFPVKVYRHCTLKINSTHGLIIGGYQDGSNSAATWYVELVTLKFTPGPTMNMERNSHGCATFHLGNKTYGIASGGWNGPDYLDTTELIDLDQTSPTWIEGFLTNQK